MLRPLIVRPTVALLAAAFALALAAPAAASERHPTLAELEGEVMCPVCNTTLDQSNSLAARRIEAFTTGRIRAGDTKAPLIRAAARRTASTPRLRSAWPRNWRASTKHTEYPIGVYYGRR